MIDPGLFDVLGRDVIQFGQRYLEQAAADFSSAGEILQAALNVMDHGGERRERKFALLSGGLFVGFGQQS